MMDQMERMPPHAIEEEMAVLGCCLIDWEEALPKTLSRLRPDDFYKPAHRKIFEAMAMLMQRQQHIDYLTVSDQLQKMSCLEEVGGAYYLTELSNFVPSSSRVGYYAKIVKEHSNLRRLITIGSKIADSAFDMGNTIEIANAAIAELYNLDTATARETFKRIDEVMMQTIQEKEAGRLDGIPTNIEQLDKLVKIQPTDLILLAGAPSMGKSAFSMEMARGFANKGTPAAIFSLEMANTQWGVRIMSEFGKDLPKRINEVIKLPIWIDDSPKQQIEAVVGKMFEMRNERNIGVFLIDYLQKIKSSRRDSRYLEVTEIGEQLKAAAKLMSRPVIALSQLSRELNKRQNKRPVLNDLRESGALEAEADVVIMLYRHGYYYPNKYDPRIVEILIKKQRQGPTGDFKMLFEMNQSRFYPYEKDERKDQETKNKPYKDDDDDVGF